MRPHHSTASVRTAAAALLLSAVTAVAGGALGPVGTAAASFPGTNGRITFTSDRAGNDDVFVIAPTGAAASVVNLSAATSSDRDAAWSPDGRRVAYTRTVAGNIDIYVQNVATRRITRVTTNRALDASPAWSPDGRRLVFVSSRVGSASGSLDLYLVRAAREGRTNRPVRISNTVGDENNPEWSPHGRLIAFDLGLVTWDVYVVRPNGTGRRAVTDSAFGVGRSYFDPTWSPNGAQLAFDNGDDVFRIAASTNGGLDCTRCTNLTPNTPNSFDTDPSWSPDGTRIAFTTDRDRLPDGTANDEVYLMAATDGSGARNLTQSPASDQQPAWGPRAR